MKKLDKKLLPWLLIASSVVIASVTYHRQANLEQDAKAADGHPAAQAANRQAATSGTSHATVTRSIRPSIAPVSIHYQCDNQPAIQAVYSDASASPSSVALNINGQRYQLHSVPSQAGKLYVTQQGIKPGQGLRWHVQGLEARLGSMPADDITPSQAMQSQLGQSQTGQSQLGQSQTSQIINNHTLQRHAAGDQVTATAHQAAAPHQARLLMRCQQPV